MCCLKYYFWSPRWHWILHQHSQCKFVSSLYLVLFVTVWSKDNKLIVHLSYKVWLLKKSLSGAWSTVPFEYLKEYRCGGLFIRLLTALSLLMGCLIRAAFWGFCCLPLFNIELPSVVLLKFPSMHGPFQG